MKPTHIMIHHSAVSHSKNSDQFRAANEYHKSKNFPKSSLGYYIGYNYTIAKSGRINQGRVPGEVTAACPEDGMNTGKCVHICIDGHFDNEKPAPAQIYALRDLVKQLTIEYEIDKNNIVFHNQYATKSCPGSNIDLQFIRSLGGYKKEKAVKEEIVEAISKLLKLVEKL